MLNKVEKEIQWELQKRCQNLFEQVEYREKRALEMQSELDSLAAENARLRAAVEWQPIQTAPLIGPVIIKFGTNDCYISIHPREHAGAIAWRRIEPEAADDRN